jgi:hypothetical protein
LLRISDAGRQTVADSLSAMRSFHQMGRYKWKELKLNYTLNDIQPPSHEAVEQACALFRDEGLKAF